MSASMTNYEKLVELINLASDGLGDDIRLIRSEVSACTMFDSLGAQSPATVLEVTVQPDAELDEWGVPEDESFEQVKLDMCYRLVGDGDGGVNLSINLPNKHDELLSNESQEALSSFLELTYQEIMASAS